MPSGRVIKVLLDKERDLRYERRSIYLLEERTGQSIVELFRQLKDGSFKAVVDLVWAGLLHEHPNLEPVEVADWVEFDRLEEITEAVAEGITNVLEAKKKAPRPGRSRARSTSKTAGRGATDEGEAETGESTSE